MGDQTQFPLIAMFANVTKKHLSIALRAAVFCSLCNLAVGYTPTKVGEVVRIGGDNGIKTGAVVSFSKSETVVKLNTAPGEEPLTVTVSNDDLIPPRPKLRQMNA